MAQGPRGFRGPFSPLLSPQAPSSGHRADPGQPSALWPGPPPPEMFKCRHFAWWQTNFFVTFFFPAHILLSSEFVTLLRPGWKSAHPCARPHCSGAASRPRGLVARPTTSRATRPTAGLSPSPLGQPWGTGPPALTLRSFLCSGVFSHTRTHRHGLALSHLRAQALSLFPSNGPSSLHWAEGWPGPPKRSCGMQVAKGWGFTLGQPAWLRTPPGKWPKTRRWSQGRAHLSSPAGEMCWAEACSRWRGGSCPLEPRSTFESAMMTWKRETGDSDLEKHPGLGEEGVGVQQRKQSCPWKKRGDRGAALLGHRKVQQACFPGCLKCSPSCKVCEITHWSLKECLIYSK